MKSFGGWYHECDRFLPLDVEKVEDPKGDRVQVIMCGKFLPYKKW